MARDNAKGFEKIFAVFDRDDHQSYFDALNRKARVKVLMPPSNALILLPNELKT